MAYRVSWSRAAHSGAVAALALMLGGWGCASGGASAGTSAGSGAVTNLSYGYIVPGSSAASALGVAPTDTLAEIQAQRTVPSVVVNAMSQEVASGHWNDRCTRRFGGPRVYVAIFHRACDSSVGPDADPVVIVAFGSDGRTAGRVRWTGPETVAVLQPMRRF
jgi:hypothetical protein